MHAEWNKWAWDLLQIAPTGDTRAVKRAYAARLKMTRPDDDADGFQRLRQAYELAVALALAPSEDQEDQEDREQPEHGDATATIVAEPLPAPLFTPAADTPAPAAPAAPTAPGEPAGLVTPEPVWFEASCTPAQSWQQFLQAYQGAATRSLHYSLANELTRHTRGKDFDHLDFAGAFEIEAARCCAGPDAAPELIEGLNAFYRWEDDASQLDAAQPGLAWQILSELRALRMHQHLVNSKTDAARALLATSVPRFSFKLYNRRFTNEMQHLIQHMRWNCPETLHRKLNPEVVTWWEQQLPRKRLQGPHLLASFLLGIAFSAMLFSSLNFSGTDILLKQAMGRTTFHISTWLLGQCLFLALTCALLFGKPAISERLHTLHQSRIGQLVWIVPAAVLSLPFLTLSHSAPWLQLTLCLAMSAVSLYVLAISSMRLENGEGMMKLAGIFVALLLVHSSRNEIFGPMYLPWAFLLTLGGEYYYRLMDPQCKYLTKLRAAWLVLSALAVMASLNRGYEAPVLLIVLNWFLAVAGMMLSSIYADSRKLPFLCVFTYFMASKFAAVFVETEIGAMLIPTTMLASAIIFTVCNLLSRTVTKQAFS